MSQIIWYDSTETGAPTLNNAAGSMLEVLRACLVNGFNLRPVTSIAVAAGVATVTSAAHGFSGTFGKLVQISGAPVAALNGNKQPGDVLTNSFTFPAPGVADGTYTGTISARRAPLGWLEAYTGTNVSIFARTVLEATSMLLRVDDTGSTIARTRMLESAASVSQFSGLSPTDAQINGGQYWQKASSAAANGWFLVGGDRGFWFGTRLNEAAKTYVYYWFGDGVPYYAADSYFCLLTGQITTSFVNTPSFQPVSSSSYTTDPSSGSLYAARGLAPSSLASELQGVSGVNTATWGGASLQPLTYEHVVMSDVVHVIGNGRVVRGEMAGLSIPLAAAPFASLSPVTAFGGAVYLPVSFNVSGSSGQVCFRLSGAWY